MSEPMAGRAGTLAWPDSSLQRGCVHDGLRPHTGLEACKLLSTVKPECVSTMSATIFFNNYTFHTVHKPKSFSTSYLLFWGFSFNTLSCCCSVSKSCPSLQFPGLQHTRLPFLHHLPDLLKLMSIESAMPSNRLILCCLFSSCLQSSPASGSFPMSWLFTSDCQRIGASALASVLPMNIQD